MVNDVEWRSLDVMAAEGMSLRVGAFKASDGEVVEFTSDVLKKVFQRAATAGKPVPMYLTHKDAGTGEARVVLGHAVKLGLEAEGDRIHYKAVMMDPAFKLMYASGYDDTSAEITPIRDETGTIVDGELTGIAVVPNPAISGTQMKVSAIAFEAPKQCSMPTTTTSGTSYISTTGGTTWIPNPSNTTVPLPSGGIKLTGKIERTLLENGVPTDKVEALVGSMEAYFSKKFEQDGLQKKYDAQTEELKFACSEKEAMKKKFEDLNKEFETYLGEKVATLINDVKGMNFANPEAVVDGLPVQQKITMLSKIKENLVASKPPTAPSVGLQASPIPPAGAQTKDQLLSEMGLTELWNKSFGKEA